LDEREKEHEMSVMSLAVNELNPNFGRAEIGQLEKIPTPRSRGVKDRAHPDLARRHPAHPGGRPAVGGSAMIAVRPRSTAEAASASASQLSERGLAAIIIGFLGAMVLGVGVVLAQFGAMSAPHSAADVPAVAAPVAAAQAIVPGATGARLGS